MEYPLCSFLSCESRAENFCRFNQSESGYCNTHMNSIDIEHERLSQSSMFSNTEMCSFKLKNQSGENTQIISILEGGYYMALHTVDITLPQEYNEVLVQIIKKFIQKIIELPIGKDELIELKCQKFLSAVRNLLFNSEALFENALNLTKEAYLAIHSGIEELLTDSLLDLLNRAQGNLNMPDKVKKYMLFGSVELETEKQRFIQEYLLSKSFDFINLPEHFYEAFKPFIKGENEELNQELKTFQEMFDSKKQEIVEKNKEKLFRSLCSLYENSVFQRIGVFCWKIGSFGELKDIDINNWTMISCMVSCKSSCYLGEVVNISESELLIPIIFNNRSLVIYQSPTLSDVALLLNTTSFKIALGSTVDSVLIIQNHPKSVELYYKALTKLLPSGRKIDLALKPAEQITSMIYIKELDKVLYITDSFLLASKFLNSPTREEIRTGKDSDKCKSLSYQNHQKLICLNTEIFIKIYNIQMVIIARIQMFSSNLTCIMSRSIKLELFFHQNSKLVQLQVFLSSIHSNPQPRDSCEIRKIKKSNHCLRYENNLEKKKSPYAWAFVGKFKAPDFLDNFDKLCVSKCERGPEEIKFEFNEPLRERKMSEEEFKKKIGANECKNMRRSSTNKIPNPPARNEEKTMPALTLPKPLLFKKGVTSIKVEKNEEKTLNQVGNSIKSDEFEGNKSLIPVIKDQKAHSSETQTKENQTVEFNFTDKVFE